MAINERYKSGFIRQVESSMKGELTHIPNPLDRVGYSFNLLQSRYTLISGSTGVGKTAMTDYMYVLGPYEFIKEHKDIHWEIIYFSLERKETFKHAKWLSWFIKQDHNYLMPADDLMGFGQHPINDKGYEFIRSYDEKMSDLLSHVQLFDGKVKASIVKNIIQRRVDDLGVLYTSDSEFIFSSESSVYIDKFSNKNLIEHTKAGNRAYVNITHKGETFKLYQDDKKYFLHNPKTFVFIIIDGINLLGNKEEIDKISLLLANARDVYGFSPVVITQQNRALGDVTRLKLHGSDMTPQIEDIFKSSQMGFDADIVLGLFDPVRYKALTRKGQYFGYNVKADPPLPSMMHPKGFSRFRSLHVLKNNFGMDGGIYGLRFTGESNHFETLPLPNDVDIHRIYAEIAEGL